jgi:hypothetical protein
MGNAWAKSNRSDSALSTIGPIISPANTSNEANAAARNASNVKRSRGSSLADCQSSAGRVENVSFPPIVDFRCSSSRPLRFTVVQYWIDQLGEAQSQREKANLNASLSNLEGDLDIEITRVFVPFYVLFANGDCA